ncbi:DUF2975 domain-containing protein [Vibrio mangrovi]|uniref:DUF2975 domain-containing protein n=1 Tax=Vibrio mangrovi TaxID=474394 RepID=A0A1Y6J306_9VIBR|nr:DUF2975 domain-containing protein [Vibrio mangrovi]MDW6002410.1 DUF2975 domain-containing protein [Vibrio mangrovi]SMS02693.1 hypothetical protein VIM7927_04028 [Vibrio mangrovi]
MTSPTDETSKIQRIALWLNLLIWAAAIFALIETGFFFFSDIPITLYLQGELWTKEFSSFAMQDQLVLFGLLSIEKVLWLGILYQFWRLCRFYRNNQVFTVQNAYCFMKTGWLLLGICLSEVALIPLVGGYLYYRQILPQMPDLQYALIFNVDYLVPGLFFWLIAKIMEQAALMQEEADLTI